MAFSTDFYIPGTMNTGISAPGYLPQNTLPIGVGAASAAAAPIIGEAIKAANETPQNNTANPPATNNAANNGNNNAQQQPLTNAQKIKRGLQGAAGDIASIAKSPLVSPGSAAAPNGSGGMPGGGQDQLSSAVAGYLNPNAVKDIGFYGIGGYNGY